MAVIFERPHALTKVVTSYCPGCSHGIIHRLVAESIDELRHEIKGLCQRLTDQKYDRLRRVFAVFLSRVVLRRTGLLREDVPELTDLQEVDNMLEESVDRWSDEILRRGILQVDRKGLPQVGNR